MNRVMKQTKTKIPQKATSVRNAVTGEIKEKNIYQFAKD